MRFDTSPIHSSHFNHFMKQGIFPDILKVGNITPVYKNKGSKQSFDCYRPIRVYGCQNEGVFIKATKSFKKAVLNQKLHKTPEN